MTKPTTLCLLLLTLFSLTGCVQPRIFFIEYDEEVKLHTGEIITVHIKRQYTRGDAIPAIWQRKPSFAWAGPVEITWDTGFVGVGNLTISSNWCYFLERVDQAWYIGCGLNSHSIKSEKMGGLEAKKYGHANYQTFTTLQLFQ